jgi:hypothetical protein
MREFNSVLLFRESNTRLIAGLHFHSGVALDIPPDSRPSKDDGENVFSRSLRVGRRFNRLLSWTLTWRWS